MANQEGGKESRGLYPMRVVEQLTGFTRRQIRYYEDQGLLAPDRTAGGQRLFSPQDVDQLLQIKSLMNRGFSTIAAIKRYLSSGLRLPAPARDLGQSSGLPSPKNNSRLTAADESDAQNYFRRHSQPPRANR